MFVDVIGGKYRERGVAPHGELTKQASESGIAHRQNST